MVNLGCIWIDFKLIPEMIFRKMGCLVVTSNSVKLKSISSWSKIRAKTMENHFRFHFHLKWFLAFENKREKERERERERAREREREGEKRRESRDRPKPSSPISSADITGTVPIAIARSVRIWWFFYGFCLCFEEWMILYIRLATEKMWENVRKYEKQVENVFSMVFSRTQPNIRKYFSKYFLKCNQTHKNIFLSRK